MQKKLRFELFELDLAAGQLSKRGMKVSLREKSFQVLASLLERPGEVVTREELQRRLWPDDVFVDFDNNLNAAIAKLRETLGDSAEHPRFIETLPRHGYRFVARVSECAPTPDPAPKIRLVVLPFQNLSGIPEQEYFSDAVTEEIITELARILPDQLAVIARTTSMHYKGRREHVARIARELDVDYVLEGSVHQTNSRLRITAQLIRAGDQAHVWAQRYDEEMGEIFRLHATVAQEVVDHIPVLAGAAQGDGAGAGRARRKPTEDPDAFTLYLQGRHQLYAWTPQGIVEGKRCFEQAIARDPHFALAYDGLAEVCWWAGFLGFMRPKEAFSAGVFAALRALELDNTLGETHALLGIFRKELDYNWPEVLREMHLALELNPESPVVHFRYASSSLMALGRMDEAIAELKHALESDPMSLFMLAWLAELYYLGRHYDRAVEQAIRLRELDPAYFLSYFCEGQARCEEGRFKEAVASLTKSAELSGGSTMVLGWLGMARARAGDRVGAREVLDRLHAIAAEAYALPTSFAWIHLGLDEIDSAYIWLERAIEDRDPIIIPIKSYAFLDPLRGDPRFTTLLRTMNLEPEGGNAQ